MVFGGRIFITESTVYIDGCCDVLCNGPEWLLRGTMIGWLWFWPCLVVERGYDYLCGQRRAWQDTGPVTSSRVCVDGRGGGAVGGVVVSGVDLGCRKVLGDDRGWIREPQWHNPQSGGDRRIEDGPFDSSSQGRQDSQKKKQLWCPRSTALCLAIRHGTSQPQRRSESEPPRLQCAARPDAAFATFEPSRRRTM